MTRKKAEQLADRFIPQVWGLCRTAWINGFINFPQKGIAKYPKDSLCADFRRRGVADRKIYDKEEVQP